MEWRVTVIGTGVVIAALGVSSCGRSGAVSTFTGPVLPSTTGDSTPLVSTGPVPPSPPVFNGVAGPIPLRLVESMRRSGTWRVGCPVAISRLRLLGLGYWGFDGTAHRGQLVVSAAGAPAVVAAFRALWRARFPIHQMRLVDAFGGSDERSMQADNTSAYNCRAVPGTGGTWSQHAYGMAVDINPRENPEIAGAVIDPTIAARYANRSLHAKGMSHPGDIVVRAFRAVGWSWGGDWHSLKDYHHFSANGL